MPNPSDPGLPEKPRAQQAWQWILPLGLVLIPVALVFSERWLRLDLEDEAPGFLFCQGGALCDLRLPSYFVLVLGALFALLIVLRRRPGERLTIQNLGLTEKRAIEPHAPAQISAQQRRWVRWLILLSLFGLLIEAARAWRYGNGQPGFGYVLLYFLLLSGIVFWEVPLSGLVGRLRLHWGRWLAAVLAHFALVWLLVCLYDADRTPWLALAATTLAFVNVWRYRAHVSPVFWVVSAALLIYTLYINAWWTAIVGDDYAFLGDALDVLEQPWALTASKFFLGAFTYGSHPYLTNIIQAAFLKLFGPHNFAWRFSSIYVAMMSLPFFYAFLKSFLQERVALIVTILLAGSHYLIAFSRIGYNNMQALFTTALMLYLAAAALRSPGSRYYAALGAAMGLSFYVFPGALLALPLPLLVLLIYKGFPGTWQAIRQWGTVGVFALPLLFPLIKQPLYWTSKLPGSILTSAESANPSFIYHSFSNLIYALVGPLYFSEESHYVVVGFMDVFSAGLFFLGLGYLVWRWRGQRFLTFMLLSFVFLLLVVGVLHNYAAPPATRMFMLMPWYAFFAGVGLLWLASQLQRHGLSAWGSSWFVGISVVLLLAVNVYQGYRLSFERSTRYQHFITMQLGILNDFFSRPGNEAQRIVIMNDAISLHVPSFWELLNSYQVPVDETRFEIVSVFGNPNDPAVVPFEEAITHFDDPNALIMVNLGVAQRAPELLVEYEEYLQAIGKQRCDVHAYTGVLRFWFWYSPELAPYCRSMAELARSLR